MNVTDTVRPAIEFCQNYPELVRVSTMLFIEGLKLNRQRFKDRTKRLAEIQILAKAVKITKEQARKATSQLREIERNMNHTFWDVKRKAYQDCYCYREVYRDSNGTEDIKAKKELNAFLDQWLSNLIEQGHCIKVDRATSC